MSVLFIAVAAAVTGGLLAAVFSGKADRGRVAAVCSVSTIALAAAGVLFVSVRVLLGGDVLTETIDMGAPLGLVRFELDALSAFFAALTAVTTLFSIIYITGYISLMPKSSPRMSAGLHYMFFNFAAASMLMALVLRNALVFLVVWEIMALSIFFLIPFERGKIKPMSAAVQFLVTMHVGAVILAAAIVMASNGTGMDFSDFTAVLSSNTTSGTIVFLLFFIGFAFKAGLMPFHSWAVHAETEAPRGVSGLLSGAAVNMGIYGILRIIALTPAAAPLYGYTVLFISMFSAVLGILYALVQNDLRRILAYSTIENAGIIGIGIGVGLLGKAYSLPLMEVLGFAGALFHVVNHSLFKGVLFYAAGAVFLSTGTSNIDRLGGLIKSMPVVAVTFLAASLSASALPPFNGFISEFLIYSGLLRALTPASGFIITVGVIAVAVLALNGAVTLAVFAKTFGITFLGTPRSNLPAALQPPASMTLPLIVLAASCLVTGLWPESVMRLIHAPLVCLGVTQINLIGNAVTITGSVARGALLLVVVTAALFLIRTLLVRTPASAPTWGCGYEAVSSRMQYTGSSLGAPLVKLVSPLLRRVEKKKFIPKSADIPGCEPFPARRVKYTSVTFDFIESMVIDKGIAILKAVFERFSWVQSGHTGHYVLYILAALAAFLFAAVWRGVA
ncbi:proton-conducting transporter transmembrane domain-containing protein [Candidatus Magnetominusculus xianensis]|uniref:Hydrogenase n=1 Tax=Candidatus Magnetominusculus xianensis TaxID=1748249 RepID=A0ABR5SET1_9BACT|nr:proton-conducting transporter membrane subunit [Candidatus Magnetominusculus xianensis]KWT85082.1 hydrogenase [Candidatus Magnetominusculus xianensis]MBF0402457.1 hypothetical protein [Nitrospirota bacterium]